MFNINFQLPNQQPKNQKSGLNYHHINDRLSTPLYFLLSKLVPVKKTAHDLFSKNIPVAFMHISVIFYYIPGDFARHYAFTPANTK